MNSLNYIIQASRDNNMEYSQRYDEYLEYKESNLIPKNFIRLDPWEIRYLYKLAKKSKVGIYEIGRMKGGSTLVLCQANKDVLITSVDNNPANDIKFKNILMKLNIGFNLRIVEDNSHTYTPEHKYDLLYVDGGHLYQECLSDLKQAWNNVVTGGHILCHDSVEEPHVNNQVRKAIWDFVGDKFENKEIEFIINPNVGSYFAEHGTFCHFIKKQ
tara:strand:+ start:56 stop:697 length:642 start_codon:yes stop_codon:yes gene_type:complete